MFKRNHVMAAVLFSALTGCGGGDEPCGEKSQTFSLSFPQSLASLHVGVPATVSSEFKPESCRGDASFALRSGALPPGMTLTNGNVSGTPTAMGEYKFQLSVDGVHGYQFLLATLVSNTVTVKVTP